ncbi:MAG TPA: DNA polymerase Y family protein [Candidatus Binatia bacterium]|nr:DNA polymerase Y family protein [Candidatus Binatia bacterium]
MFACIFIPNFPVAAMVRAEPELRPQAVAIFDGKPPLEKIGAVNEKAGAMKITTGMTKAQAELCPEIALRARSSAQEASAHAALLDCAQSFSPCVEDAATDTAILDLAGMESLFGTLPEIVRAISDRAAGLGLNTHVAIASNPDAAVLAARGFSGTTLIPAGKEAAQLGRLPVAVLFAGAGMDEANLLEMLERWGIRNLHDLAVLPEVALSERLGQQGLHLQKLARGAAARTLVPVKEPLVFEESVELEYPVVLLEPLAFLLNRMLEQICARLAARALATQELRLTMETAAGPRPSAVSQTLEPEDGGTGFFSDGRNRFQRTLRLPLPMLDAKLFLKLLQLDLNAHPPGAPIFKIHLAAEPARSRSAQGGLFLPPAPEPEKLELTLARIAGIVGESRVGSVELLDTHRAEGFRMKRFTAAAASETKSSGNILEEKPSIAALRIFRPPLRVTVTLQNGGPSSIVCAKKKEVQGVVLWKAGPWRSSGDWWEREAWSRDEWDIAVQGAEEVALYRLVHDLLDGIWFVEGTYD